MRWYEERAKLRAEVERRADGRSPVVAERWVRIECDYATGPVWSRDGVPGQPEEVPINLDLMVRLHRRTDLFEELEDPEHDGNRWTPEQDRALRDEGLAIAIE
jgi:hypothetical protein